MTQSFDEWRNAQRTQVNGYTERDAFEAGAQSQQTKIDELQKRIDNIASIIHDAYMSGGNSSVEIVYDKVKEILK